MSAKCRENTASEPFSRLGWMGRHRAILLALVLGLVAAATLSACGGEEKADLLPGETASEINANLNLVEDLVAAGDCVGAENAAAAVSGQVESLTGVDQELVETLSKGAARLQEVIGECEEAPEEDEETAASEEEPDLEELEKEERDEEKAQEKAEKDAEKDQKKEEKPEKETPSTESPDQEKEPETEVPPTEPTNPPSGGVSPSTEAGGAE
jgi:outer membrane biosynthesis protein TonB